LKSIAILDYGSGNLRSAQRAIEHIGAVVEITSDADVALNADGLVVPGVGAFKACMSGILGVDGKAIMSKRVAAKRPVLGICIGMQVLFTQGLEHSEGESGGTDGCAIWPGQVSQLSAPVLPHMGWNNVKAGANSKLLAGLDGESFYFVHSYAVKESSGLIESRTTYGESFIAAAEDGIVSATQFHPEKSGDVGLQLLKNWVQSL